MVNMEEQYERIALNEKQRVGITICFFSRLVTLSLCSKMAVLPQFEKVAL